MTTKELAREIERSLKAEGAETEFEEDDGCFHVGTTVESKHFEFYVLIFTCFEDRVAATYIPPIEIRHESYPEVCDYLMRVNFQIPRGKVLLDYKNAKLRFVYHIDVATIEKDVEEALDEMFYAPLLAMEVIIPDFLAVMNKEKTPAGAAADYDKGVDDFIKKFQEENGEVGNQRTRWASGRD